ncbi:hypothetical protein NQ315_003215 [Exocentrus adspersus]|uniref:Uncharacterized protein n=1 Tax=Exocentrus adspersus TaxID=1586481 RepID=A0AAV8VM76_9CUCU|nr:hypothetical protein NQ315_003215 [Exocentrus adspersus]
MEKTCIPSIFVSFYLGGNTN